MLAFIMLGQGRELTIISQVRSFGWPRGRHVERLMPFPAVTSRYKSPKSQPRALLGRSSRYAKWCSKWCSAGWSTSWCLEGCPRTRSERSPPAGGSGVPETSGAGNSCIRLERKRAPDRCRARLCGVTVDELRHNLEEGRGDAPRGWGADARPGEAVPFHSGQGISPAHFMCPRPRA